MKNNELNINSNKGFTLIELLVVIGILAVLMGIVLVAINPARQFNQANDARRANDARQILNAIGNYLADNKGSTAALTLAGLTSSPADIGDGSGQVNICSLIVPQYISALPEDPSILNGTSITSCSGYDSGYQASIDSQGRVTITAPRAALTTISITR